MQIQTGMPDHVPPEHHLADIAFRRDRQAFAALFREMAPKLNGWFRRAGVPDQADELTQEVMLRVWRKADRYDPRKASASTWIFTIARNVRIDHLRKGRVQVYDADPVLVASNETPPDERFAQAQQAETLRSAIRSLPEEQATILHAAYFQQKTLRSIATEQSVPLGTVKSRVRLALASLRRVLGRSA